MSSDNAILSSKERNFLVPLGLTLVAIAATLVMVFVFTEPPRSTVAWSLGVILMLIEMLVCAFVLMRRLGQKSVPHLSSPMWAGLWLILGFYAVVEVVSIIVYANMQNQSRLSDGRFLAVLLLETVISFILAVVLVVYDKSLRLAEQPAFELREQDHSASLSIREALEAVRNLGTSDAPIMRRADVLGKRLYGVQEALAHSHGGGLGTPEQTPPAKGGDAARREAGVLVASLCSAAVSLASRDPAEPARSLAMMEEHAARLEAVIRQLGLQ